MKIIATADKNYWPEKIDENCFFLGEWCFSETERKSNYKVLKYHWSNNAQFNLDYKYLDNLYKKKLIEISKNLNSLHNLDYSNKYWENLIGNWLSRFIQVFYDRYQTVALTNQVIDGELVCNFDNSIPIYSNYSEFIDNSYSDEFNNQLYKFIFKHTTKHKLLEKNNIETNFSPNQKKLRFFEKLLTFYNRFVPDFLNKKVFVQSYIPLLELFKLQISLGQLPYYYVHNNLNLKPKVSKSLRKKIILNSSDDSFENLLNKVLLKQIPFNFIENYHFINKIAINKFPKNPKSIISAVALDSCEFFPFWFAISSENGSKSIGIQHGGNYGSAKIQTFEDFEIKINDLFLTWGWSNKSNKKVISFSSPKLLKRKIYSFNENKKILWALTSFPRYNYAMYSYPHSSRFLKFIEDQINFGSNLNKSLRENIFIRDYRIKLGWDQLSKIKSHFNWLKIATNSIGFSESLNSYSIFIGTHNTTTFLESLSINMPTIIFWDSNDWEIRDEAKFYYDQLVEAKILFYDPKSAALHLNNIYDNIPKWWNNKNVQNAKDNYLSKFANVDKNFNINLKKIILQNEKQ